MGIEEKQKDSSFGAIFGFILDWLLMIIFTMFVMAVVLCMLCCFSMHKDELRQAKQFDFDFDDSNTVPLKEENCIEWISDNAIIRSDEESSNESASECLHHDYGP